MNWTLDHIEKLYAAGRIRNYKVTELKTQEFHKKPQESKKRSKFGNNKTEVDGITFDSEKEAKRYGELKLMRKAGLIGLLQLQVEYELNAGGTHSLKYVADFVYVVMATGDTVVEDVKGFRTVIYRKKKKLMKKVWGIDIKEV